MPWSGEDILGYAVVGGAVYAAGYYAYQNSRGFGSKNPNIANGSNNAGYEGNIPPPPRPVKQPQGGYDIYGYFRNFWDRQPTVKMEL